MKPLTIFRALLGLALALCAAAASANVTCPKVFQDHMVLQRQMPVPIWGKAEPGEQVTVTFAGATVDSTAGQDGKWMVKLPKMEASAESRELTVTGKNTITFKDVLVGEVWLIGGQSNAESNLSWCCPEDGRTANIPLLRVLKVDHVMSKTPADDCPMTWQTCEPQRALNFSAAGFYFCRKLIDELKIPVGLIDDNWGGSNIRFWIPEAGWNMIPELKPELEQRDKDMATYQAKMKDYLAYLDKWAADSRTELAAGRVAEQLNFPPERVEHGFMFNGMIAPVIPYAIRGLLWYQGEYNAGDPGDIYYHKMRGLIGSWRNMWGEGDIPCYFVQLPNLDQPDKDPAGGNGWARMREVQTKAMQIPNTGMIVTIDIGEAGDIHPKNKLDVGERLALWALAKDYGKKIVYSGPLYKGIQIGDGKIRISFDSIGGGLMVGKKELLKPTVEDKGAKLQRFAIAGEDKQWFWADAVIDGKTVLVSSPQVPKPVAVRYAFSMNPAGCNLYNKEGLPASPFRTDNW